MRDPSWQPSSAAYSISSSLEERRLARGSLIVRTPAGEIDATFDGKTAKIADALRETALSRKVTDRNARNDAA